MAKLKPGYEINLLRDLRKRTPDKWLTNEGFIGFETAFPNFEKIVRANENIIKEVLDMTAEEFMDNLSKKRPATNFNPGNKLGKPRYKWSKKQIRELNRVRGL